MSRERVGEQRVDVEHREGDSRLLPWMQQARESTLLCQASPCKSLWQPQWPASRPLGLHLFLPRPHGQTRAGFKVWLRLPPNRSCLASGPEVAGGKLERQHHGIPKLFEPAGRLQLLTTRPSVQAGSHLREQLGRGGGCWVRNTGQWNSEQGQSPIGTALYYQFKSRLCSRVADIPAEGDICTVVEGICI